MTRLTSAPARPSPAWSRVACWPVTRAGYGWSERFDYLPLPDVGDGPPPGAKAGNAIYVSGTLALDSNGKTVGIGDVRAQTRHVLESIGAVLRAGGGSYTDITFNHIFLKDLDDYAAMNEVYKEYFPKNPPARYCIRADLVKPRGEIIPRDEHRLDRPW